MRSATVFGIEADDVFVEVDVEPGLPSFTRVGSVSLAWVSRLDQRLCLELARTSRCASVTDCLMEQQVSLSLSDRRAKLAAFGSRLVSRLLKAS